jgi:LuxR family transcriptional regulator, maltose regulon positive regulatory protein
MLGQFQVWQKQKILTWPTQKSKALLQILLIEPGRLVPTDQILEYLWPTLTPQKALNNLWVTISQLRRVLQPDNPPRERNEYIHKLGEGYKFNNVSNYSMDVETFTSHLSKAKISSDILKVIKPLESAQSLYQGEYLEDEPYAEWAQASKIQWKISYEQLLVNLAQNYALIGKFKKAILTCRVYVFR